MALLLPAAVQKLDRKQEGGREERGRGRGERREGERGRRAPAASQFLCYHCSLNWDFN